MPPGVDRLYGAARYGACANGLSGRNPSTRYECTIWVFSARLATRTLMPMLPPRLRIRLRIAVPWVRMWRGSVDSARMLSGTWVQPRPYPCSSPEMMTGAFPICSENWLICHIDSAVNRKPKPMISRLSTRMMSGATTERRRHGAEAARHGHKAGRHRRIAHQVLQHRRQQCERSGHDQPAGKHQHRTGGEIGTLQQVAVEERRSVGRYRVHAEQVEAKPRDRRFDPDLARIEPVLQLAAVEQQLQGADPQAQREETDDVERLAMDVAAVVDEDEDAKRTQQTDRQVDVEHPAPAVFLGQPAVECRPHYRPADRADAEHRHCVRVPLRWADLQQGGC